MVFFLMRLTGDPITAALGGRLPADQLAERIHAAGYDRPIIVQYLEYLGQIFTGNFGTTITDNRPVTDDPAHLRRGDPRAGVLRADRRVRRRHPARHDRRLPARPLAGRGRCGSSRSSPTRRRCSSPACCSSSSSRSGWAGCPVAGRAIDPHRARARTAATTPTGIYLIDAIRLGQPGDRRRRARARGAARRSRSAC